VNPDLKYGAEALFFVGVAYRLLRWIIGALREGAVAPSAFPSETDLVIKPMLGMANSPAAGSADHQMAPHHLTEHERLDPTAWYRTGIPDAPPGPGDMRLFPPEMLAAMTPEQREKVLTALAKQHGDGA